MLRSNGVADRRFLLVLLDDVFSEVVRPSGVFLEMVDEFEAGVSGSVGQLGDQVEMVDGLLVRVEMVIEGDVAGVFVQGSVGGSVQGSEGGPLGLMVVLVVIEDPDLVIELSKPRMCSL